MADIYRGIFVGFCNWQNDLVFKERKKNLAKRYKHDKVIRGYDGIDREESTAGLMALRVFIILIIILFIFGALVLFLYSVMEETKEEPQNSVSTVDDGAFYQKYDTDIGEELLKYCSNTVPFLEYEKFDIVDYDEKIKVNSLMKESLERMIADAKKDGIRLDVFEGYISPEDCDIEFQSIRLELEEQGATLSESERQARSIFPPGVNNEFQTGMLVKFSDMESDDFSLTDEYKWLYKNGVNYGFINRYTDDKFSYTGINEDLTIYRFVGTENARKMRSFGMSLEEYYDYCSYTH